MLILQYFIIFATIHYTFHYVCYYSVNNIFKWYINLVQDLLSETFITCVAIK